MIQKIILPDVYKAVINRESSSVIDTTIGMFLEDNNMNQTVEEWKAENADLLRKWAYPSPMDICRSLLKIHSSDPAKQAEGQAEVDLLNGECDQIDNDFPHNTPQVSVITAAVTRQPGWQGALGWRMDFTFSDPEYVPANVAIGVHSLPDCGQYLYTPGALQFDGSNYYTECPAGQEPGDTDIHFELLYASLSMSCFTLPAGVSSQTFEIYNVES